MDTYQDTNNMFKRDKYLVIALVLKTSLIDWDLKSFRSTGCLAYKIKI